MLFPIDLPIIHLYGMNQYHLELKFSKGSLIYNFTWDYYEPDKLRENVHRFLWVLKNSFARPYIVYRAHTEVPKDLNEDTKGVEPSR